jgi:hypothetical protein
MSISKKHNIDSDPFSLGKNPRRIQGRGRITGPIQKRPAVIKGAINQAVAGPSQLPAIAEDASPKEMEQFYGNDSLGG